MLLGRWCTRDGRFPNKYRRGPRAALATATPVPPARLSVNKKLSVLIIRASWASLHVDLVIVVLAGTLKQRAELQRVVPSDPGKAVRQAIDGT